MKDAAKGMGDLTAWGITLASLIEILPVLAAALGVAWWGMRLVQTFLEIRANRERFNHEKLGWNKEEVKDNEQ
jgi:hypothetical protein